MLEVSLYIGAALLAWPLIVIIGAFCRMDPKPDARKPKYTITQDPE
jgi:hypothetical protein